VLESESVLDIHHYKLLYTPCWSSLIRPCAPIRVNLLLVLKQTILLRERESIFFYRFTPTLSGKSVCGKVLIRSILVLLFSSEVPLKKYEKRYRKKKK
jgi:hypothetical protein